MKVRMRAWDMFMDDPSADEYPIARDPYCGDRIAMGIVDRSAGASTLDIPDNWLLPVGDGGELHAPTDRHNIIGFILSAQGLIDNYKRIRNGFNRQQKTGFEAYVLLTLENDCSYKEATARKIQMSRCVPY